jgi:6-phosphogluconolactonase
MNFTFTNRNVLGALSVSLMIATTITTACTESGGSKSGGKGGSSNNAGGSAEGGQGGRGAAGEGGGAGAGTGGSKTGGTAGSGGTGGTGKTGGAGGTAMTGGTGGIAATGGTGGTPVVPTSAFVYISGFETSDMSIRIFSMDLTTGTLTANGGVSGDFSPGYGAMNPRGTNAYFLNETYDSSQHPIKVFKINAGTGALTGGTDRPATGRGNVHMSMDPTGKWLLMSSFGSNSVKVFPVDAQGDVGAEVDSVNPAANAQPHQVITDIAGKYVFSPCLGGNIVASWELNNATGKLTFKENVALTDGPRHMAFHPSEKYAYVLTEKDSNVVSYDYDKATGKLTNPMRNITRAGEDWGSHIVVSPNGKFVFAAVRRMPRLYVFTVNPQNGQLTAGDTFSNADLGVPRDFAIDPTGKYLVIASQNLKKVLVASIDQTTGKLTKVGATLATAGDPSYVGIVPKR